MSIFGALYSDKTDVNIIVSQIVSGVPIAADWSPGDAITNEVIYDTYVRYSGADILVDFINESIFHNGFTGDNQVDTGRIIELLRGSVWNDMFGFSAILYDEDNVQAVNPKVAGIGFQFTKFDWLGNPLEIEVFWNPEESNKQALGIPVSKDNFIALRTKRGLAGARGLSKMINLINPIRAAYDIFAEYGEYAKIQGLTNRVIRIKNMTDTKYDKYQQRITKHKHDKTVFIDMDDEMKWESPMSNAYDPFLILDKADQYISRSSHLNKLQLSGDPGGIIATSQTATQNWIAVVKQEQDFILSMIKPILIVLGCEEDVKFNDPTEHSIDIMMDGILKTRTALEGLVEPEQLVTYINEYLGLSEDKAFTLVKDYGKDLDKDPDEKDQEKDQQ